MEALRSGKMANGVEGSLQISSFYAILITGGAE